MKKKLSLIVTYKNSLDIWHISTEQIINNAENGFISIEYFAEFVADRYLLCGGSEVVCIEFLKDNISKANLNNLAKVDYFPETTKNLLGRRWTFTKEKETGSEVDTE